MQSRWMLVAVLSAVFATGCADRFRAAAPASTDASEPAPASGATLLRVEPPPPDLAWLTEAFRLFSDSHPGVMVQVSGRSSSVAAPGQARFAASVAGGSGLASPSSSQGGAEIDLRIVSLPLTAGEAAGLAAAPGPVEAAISPALLPQARRAAQQDGRPIALPISARWYALAWNPARLTDSPTPVPPHLEAWVDQLRALRQRQPVHAPLIVAWGEKEIAGSFALLLAAQGGRLLDEAGQPAFVSAEGEATLQLMIRMLEEGLVQPTALETGAERLASSLTGAHAYWLCPSEALSATGAAGERLSGVRLGGVPVARSLYRYPEMTVAALVQYRGVAVRSASPRAATAWRLARFVADPVLLRGSPSGSGVLAEPPRGETPLMQQARSVITQSGTAPWPDPPGLGEALGRFLHAALRRILTPQEALERAALQYRQPGALPEEGDNEASRTPSVSPDGGSPGEDATSSSKGGYTPGSGSGYVGPMPSGSGADSDGSVPPASGTGAAPSTSTDGSPGSAPPSTPDLRSAPEVR